MRLIISVLGTRKKVEENIVMTLQWLVYFDPRIFEFLNESHLVVDADYMYCPCSPKMKNRSTFVIQVPASHRIIFGTSKHVYIIPVKVNQLSSIWWPLIWNIALVLPSFVPYIFWSFPLPKWSSSCLPLYESGGRGEVNPIQHGHDQGVSRFFRSGAPLI